MKDTVLKGYFDLLARFLRAVGGKEQYTNCLIDEVLERPQRRDQGGHGLGSRWWRFPDAPRGTVAWDGCDPCT